jgi:prepilin-type N-terminal cleavage/methylation domain-containing protein
MSSQKGICLVELMIAVMIVGLLTAVAYPSYYSRRVRAMEAKVIANMHAAQLAVEDYASITGGVYPQNFYEQVGVTNPNIIGDNRSIAGVDGASYPVAPCMLPDNVRNPVSIIGWAFYSCAMAVATPPVHPGGLVNPAVGAEGDQGSFSYHSADISGGAAVTGAIGGNAAKYAIYGYGVSSPMPKIISSKR